MGLDGPLVATHARLPGGALGKRTSEGLAFLFQFGTGPIRGFATTLFFGLISNVFTAVFASRTLFELSLSRKPGAAKLSI